MSDIKVSTYRLVADLAAKVAENQSMERKTDEAENQERKKLLDQNYQSSFDLSGRKALVSEWSGSADLAIAMTSIFLSSTDTMQEAFKASRNFVNSGSSAYSQQFQGSIDLLNAKNQQELREYDSTEKGISDSYKEVDNVQQIFYQTLQDSKRSNQLA